jgi:hypothetical protein
VSDYIRDLPFLWVDVDDQPGPESERAYIERNIIALASNYDSESIDSRESGWLGDASPCEEIGQSGLWNVNHVGEKYDPAVLDRFAQAIDKTTPP